MEEGAPALFGRRLGGADIQVAVDLHRVDGDYFAAETLGHADRHFRLAGRRRTTYHQQGGTLPLLHSLLPAFKAPIEVINA